MEFILGGLLCGVLVFAIIFGMAILNGFVLSILWGWFIVPVFHLAVLSIPQAIGLGMIVAFLTYRYEEKDDNTKLDKKLGKKYINNFDWSVVLLRYPLVLIFGYIVHLFM